MPDYSKSIIYKLCCKDIHIKELYVGSTCNQLKARKNKHKSSCDNMNGKEFNYKVYQFIRSNGGFSNWDMVEVERYEAIDKQDLNKRERYYIELLGATLNTIIPYRSKEEINEIKKEYFQNNKVIMKEQHKLYRESNQEKNKEMKKKYYYNNRDILINKSKEYRDKNVEIIKDKTKKYRELNRDKFSEKVKCDVCNKEMRRDGVNRHKKQFHTN
jgi:hypothetical protein